MSDDEAPINTPVLVFPAPIFETVNHYIHPVLMEHYYEDIPGFFWFKQGYKNLLHKMPKDRLTRFVEIGSFCGKSACFLAIEAINQRTPLQLHCVDSFVGLPNNDATTGDKLREQFMCYTEPIARALGDNFQLHDMDSLAASKQFDDASLDVVWVDGDHSYDGCMADILAWWPKLKVGGWMGGDDWFMEGVQRAVGEQFAPGYVLGHGYARSPDITGYWPWWLVRKS